MLMIHESLVRFRVLPSANNRKIYDLLPSKVSLYYVLYSFLEKSDQFQFIYPPLCVKAAIIRPKGIIASKAFIIQLTKELDFVDLRT